MPDVFKLFAALEITLTVCEGFSTLGGVLPLCGSHQAQLGVLFAGTYVIKEVAHEVLATDHSGKGR